MKQDIKKVFNTDVTWCDHPAIDMSAAHPWPKSQQLHDLQACLRADRSWSNKPGISPIYMAVKIGGIDFPH